MCLYIHEFKLSSRIAQIPAKWPFEARMALIYGGWPRQVKGHLSDVSSSFVRHFGIAFTFELKLQSVNAQFGPKSSISWTVWSWKSMDDMETIGHLSLWPQPNLCASFPSHTCIKTGVTVRKRTSRVKIVHFSALQFEGWSWKTIGHLFATTLNFVHHFVTICEFKLELYSGSAQNGATFVLNRVTWTFDLWPCAFACTSFLSMVIIPENFTTIQWWEYCEKGMMGGRTDAFCCLVPAKKYDICTIIYFKKMGISILPFFHWLSVVAQYVQPWFDKYTDRFGFTNLIILWCQVMCLWWQDSKHGCTIWIHLTTTKYGWPWGQYLLSSWNAVPHLYLSFLLYISEQHERRWCENSCFEM